MVVSTDPLSDTITIVYPLLLRGYPHRGRCNENEEEQVVWFNASICSSEFGKMTLLFLSRDGELHTDWLEAECERRGVPYSRLCPDHLDSTLNVTIEVNNAGFGGNRTDTNGTVDLNQVTGVWHRRPLSPSWAEM